MWMSSVSSTIGGGGKLLICLRGGWAWTTVDVEGRDSSWELALPPCWSGLVASTLPLCLCLPLEPFFFFFEEMVPFPMDILAAFEEKQSVICNDQSNFWLLYLFLYFALVLF
jgi:hypothetical protein